METKLHHHLQLLTSSIPSPLPPQERNNSETSATMMHDTVFTIAERQVFEAKVPFSSGIEDDDFPFDSIDDM